MLEQRRRKHRRIWARVWVEEMVCIECEPCVIDQPGSCKRCTPYAIALHGRAQEVDLVDKIPEDGECVRHPEKDHEVAKMAAKLPQETAPRIIKRRARTERAKLTGHNRIKAE